MNEFTLHVTRSGIDGWVWLIRRRGVIVDGGSAATGAECRRDGAMWLKWQREAAAVPKRSYAGHDSFGE